MTLNHILTLALGVGVVITGAFTGTSAILIPIGTTIIGGVFGHAGQPDQTKQNP